MRTIAHWIPVTRQALDDVPTLRSYLDGRLRYGVRRAVEAQFLNGTGTGQQILGLRNTPGIQKPNDLAAGTSRLAAILAAVGAVQSAEYPADGVVLSYPDFMALVGELNERQTPLGDAVITGGAGGLSVLGARVAVSAKMPSGSVLAGAFGIGAAAFDRQDTRVLIADQHADFFIRNQYALLAETRVTMGVYLPLAFAEVTIADPAQRATRTR